MYEPTLYRDTVEFWKEADDDMSYHLKTCGECREHGPCPLSKELLETYNFSVLAVRVWEKDNEGTETALPRV